MYAMAKESAPCALGRIIISFRARSRRLSTRCSRLAIAGAARSEVVGKNRPRRAAPVSPVTLRPSSRRLSLVLQLMMFRRSRGEVSLAVFVERAVAGLQTVKRSGAEVGAR
jgi:hypothetical protein